MAVMRCVCHNVTFLEIRRLHRAVGLGFDEICDRTGCCRGCTTCEPYVRLVLRTGETRFAPLSPVEEAAIMRSAAGSAG